MECYGREQMESLACRPHMSESHLINDKNIPAFVKSWDEHIVSTEAKRL